MEAGSREGLNKVALHPTYIDYKWKHDKSRVILKIIHEWKCFQWLQSVYEDKNTQIVRKMVDLYRKSQITETKGRLLGGKAIKC